MAQLLNSWRWLRWLALAATIALGAAKCVLLDPHSNVLPFAPNFPQRNPAPTRTITIEGRMAENVSIQILAYYATSHPTLGEAGYESCYRNIPLGSSINLHIAEPLDIEHNGANYKAVVVADKFQPGECGWFLKSIDYRILDSARDPPGTKGLGANGLSIVNFLLPPDIQTPPHWRGKVDLWCYAGRIGRVLQSVKACGTAAAFITEMVSRVPAEQRGVEASTWMFSGDNSAEVNFHDLNALLSDPRAP